MKIYVISVLALLSAAVLAEETEQNQALSQAEWQRLLANRPSSQIIDGQKLYSQAGCAGCHGDVGQGNPDFPQAPKLINQSFEYIYKILLDFREERLLGLMPSRLSHFNGSDMANLAGWLASLPKRGVKVQEDLKLSASQTQLVQTCESCHGIHGQGAQTIPSLFGQKKAYLVEQLNYFKNNARSNDINQGMARISKQLSAEDIEMLAEYFSRL